MLFDCYYECRHLTQIRTPKSAKLSCKCTTIFSNIPCTFYKHFKASVFLRYVGINRKNVLGFAYLVMRFSPKKGSLSVEI